MNLCLRTCDGKTTRKDKRKTFHLYPRHGRLRAEQHNVARVMPPRPLHFRSPEFTVDREITPCRTYEPSRSCFSSPFSVSPPAPHR